MFCYIYAYSLNVFRDTKEVIKKYRIILSHKLWSKSRPLAGHWPWRRSMSTFSLQYPQKPRVYNTRIKLRITREPFPRYTAKCSYLVLKEVYWHPLWEFALEIDSQAHSWYSTASGPIAFWKVWRIYMKMSSTRIAHVHLQYPLQKYSAFLEKICIFKIL